MMWHTLVRIIISAGMTTSYKCALLYPISIIFQSTHHHAKELTLQGYINSMWLAKESLMLSYISLQPNEQDENKKVTGRMCMDNKLYFQH